MAHGSPDKVRRDRKLIQEIHFGECAVNLLLLHSILRPGIADTKAELEQKAAEDILALVTAMREHTNRTGAINASGHKFADLDIIQLRRRHTLPACGGNGGVKSGATILRQPVPHCDHSAQHDRRDLALARSVLKGVRGGSPNRRRWVQQPANRNLDGGSLAGKQKCRGHHGAVLVR